MDPRTRQTFRYFPPASAPPPAGRTPADPGRVRGRRLIAFGLTAIFLLSIAAGAGLWLLVRLYDTLPSVEELENIEPPLVSKVIARDGSVINEFGTERRFWVSVDSMPQNLLDAVVATEDRKFYDHWGIDVKRILGAVLVDLVHRESAQGASTITQQLARNVYLTSRKSMVRKIREILTAIQIEKHYAKKEVLELYLNQVYLGAGCFGMEAASQRYFSKHVWELSLNECAVLAGTIQLPEYYRPDKQKNMIRILNRRNSVIRSMLAMHAVDKATARNVMESSVDANPMEPASKTAPYLMDLIRQYVIDKYGEDELYSGGLVIYTTLDPVAQDTAEVAAAAQLIVLQKRLNRMCVDSSGIAAKLGIPRDTLLAHFDSLHAVHEKAFDALPDSVRLRTAQVVVVALDVQTGAMLTLIGGRNFDETKFDRALQALRQPGSAFKPFVYTAAIEHGFAPMSVVLDQPVTIATPQGDWRPENFDKEFLGPVTIRQALYKSLNLPAIQMLLAVGADTVVMCARRMGITTPLSAVPSLAIGACEVIPMEIISAYGIFPNAGMRVTPYCIEKIADKSGKLLETHAVAPQRVLSPQVAFIMCDMMSDVVRRGTAAKIPGMGFTRPAAGKTGTTNDFSDAWFIGYTPQIVCGVWVGVDERRSLGRGVTGAEGALPIWVPAARALHRSLPVENFHRPDGVAAVNVCRESHKLAGDFCPDPLPDYVIAGTDPSMTLDSCDIHTGGRLRRSPDYFGPGKGKRGADKRRPQMF